MRTTLDSIAKKHWLVYPVLIIKTFLFYWVAGMLDMMIVYEVPLLTILFFLTLYEVFSMKESRVRRSAFTTIYIFLSVLLFMDAAYSSYFGRYLSVNQIYQLGSLAQIATGGNVVEATVSPLCVLMLIDIPFVIMWYRSRNRKKTGMVDSFVKAMNTRKEKPGRFVGNLLSLIFHTALYTTAICSLYYYGFNPQNLRSVQRVNHIEIVTYHINDVLVNVAGKMRRGQVDEKEILSQMKQIVPASEGDFLHGAAKGRNLILIQTESMNDFVIGAQYNGQEITPNLNQLLNQDTLYFDHCYSTTGVGNTADAEFSTLNSLYANDERECYRMFVDNTYNGLPWMLREKGYEAMAFHGYIKTFWNRFEAYKNQGFQHYYSEEELEMTEKEGFGLTDKEMFRQAVDILKTKKQPFFSFMITLTNHIPYELDSSRASLKLKPEDKNSLFGHYLQTIRYTDEAFGDLIRLLKENGMYDNTMIVIYGDHQGMNLETRAVRYKMSEFLGKEYNYEEMLNIPLLFHIPGLGEHRTIHTVAGEVDIMPTIANLMDLDPGQPYIFGHDLLNTDEGFIAQVSYIGKGSYISGNDHEIFKIGKDGTVESGRLLSTYDGSEKSFDAVKAGAGSERSRRLIDLCQEVLAYNLIANHVHH